MYPNLSKLLLYGSDKSIEKAQEVEDYEFMGYPKLNVSLPDLRQMLQQNIHLYDARQYKIIDKFLKDEQEYVDRLAVLEVQKFDLAMIKIPIYDLENLFGNLEDIKELHENIFPGHLIQLRDIEDILRVFVMNSGKLRIYVEDQWQKSQVKFSGKEVLLKKFYNKSVVNDLSLPEQKISDYLKFHEHLKSNCEYLKSSDVFQQSFQLFNNIYIQMQYVKQAAVIEKFPMPMFQNIRLVNLFQINIDSGLPTQYKVFCMDDSMVMTTAVNQNQVGKVEISIRNDTISLNATTKDELSFEMYVHTDKTHKKVYTFVAANTYVRNEWIQTLNEILYKQMVVVRQRVRSNTDESPGSEKKFFPN